MSESKNVGKKLIINKIVRGKVIKIRELRKKEDKYCRK
jgi:hypothetical protein